MTNEKTNAISCDNESVSAAREPIVSEHQRTVEPRTSVVAKSDVVTLEVEVPGVARESISISVHDDHLTITAEPNQSATPGGKYLLRERNTDVMRRTYILGSELDCDKILANHENGLLTITIPKKAAAVPRTIAIS